MRREILNLAAVAALGAVFGNSAASAAFTGTDNASASVYSDGLQTGDDGTITGDAFGPWTTASTSANGGAGFFFGSSTSLASGSGANIDSGGKSFGTYSFGGAGNTASASRPFNGALVAGQSFSADVAVNFRGGLKGIEVLNSSNTSIFNFTVGDLGIGDDYTVRNATTGNGSVGNSYSNNTAFRIVLTQSNATGGTFSITRSGGVTDFDTGTYTGVATAFRLYHQNGPGGSEQDLFSNNFSISAVPEPASLAVAGAAGLLMRRRRPG